MERAPTRVVSPVWDQEVLTSGVLPALRLGPVVVGMSGGRGLSQWAGHVGVGLTRVRLVLAEISPNNQF